MARKDPVTGRFVAAERTTTTITETLTIGETHHDDTTPLNWVPGWDTRALQTRHAHRQQRATQVRQAAFLVAAAAEGGITELDPETLRQAVVILRAGPGASPMELAFGRSI